jgi:hypothetical protein
MNLFSMFQVFWIEFDSISHNGLQPGFSCDANGLRTIGKIELLREKIVPATEI